MSNDSATAHWADGAIIDAALSAHLTRAVYHPSSEASRRWFLQREHGPDALVVIVYGQQAPQGSKVRGRVGGVYESAAATLKPWREAVKHAVIDMGQPTIHKGVPVAVEITTSRKRPDSHWGTGRNGGTLKPRFEEARPTAAPDGDKLERAILDALKWGGAYFDDAQVTEMVWSKRYATPGSGDPRVLDRPGAVIVVRAL